MRTSTRVILLILFCVLNVATMQLGFLGHGGYMILTMLCTFLILVIMEKSKFLSLIQQKRKKRNRY